MPGLIRSFAFVPAGTMCASLGLRGPPLSPTPVAAMAASSSHNAGECSALTLGTSQPPWIASRCGVACPDCGSCLAGLGFSACHSLFRKSILPGSIVFKSCKVKSCKSSIDSGPCSLSSRSIPLLRQKLLKLLRFKLLHASCYRTASWLFPSVFNSLETLNENHYL